MGGARLGHRNSIRIPLLRLRLGAALCAVRLWGGLDLSGRVVYHAGPSQTGVRFLYREGGGSRRLRELVRRFKAL